MKQPKDSHEQLRKFYPTVGVLTLLVAILCAWLGGFFFWLEMNRIFVFVFAGLALISGIASSFFISEAGHSSATGLPVRLKNGGLYHVVHNSGLIRDNDGAHFVGLLLQEADILSQDLIKGETGKSAKLRLCGKTRFYMVPKSLQSVSAGEVIEVTADGEIRFFPDKFEFAQTA